MAWDYQFVDSISASPTVRLDLKTDWFVRDDTDFGMPELRRAEVSSLLVDGETYPAAAYSNRTITLVLEHKSPGLPDAVAVSLQALVRELDRPRSLLRYQPGTGAPVFFRTFRTPPSSVRWDAARRVITAEVPAEPFGLGPRETLPAVTVYNDPAEGTELNSNPYFEVEGVSAGGSNPGFETGTASAWSVVSGSIAASQDVVKVGAWAGKLTADGGANPRATHSQSGTVVTAGEGYTISGWLYAPTALPSTASITIQWYTAGGAFISQNVLSATLTAGVWSYLEGSFTAPVTAERAARQFSMNGTPAAGVLLYGDDIQVRVAKPANWTGIGGTVVRSTAQAHEGVASLLLTPDGVTATVEARADLVPATAGQTYRASAWVRCAVSRSVAVGINWHESGGAFISQSVTSVAVTANTWTLLDFSAVAPALTGQARLLVGGLAATPPASHLLWIDEARIRQVGSVGGMCFDVASPKGDVETPLYLSFAATDLTPTFSTWSFGYGRRQSVVAVRRGGTPSQAPLVLKAETMTPVTETTVQPNDTAMSGSGQNFMRTTFATETALDVRLLTSTFPATASTDVRGTYRVFARVRQTVGGDVMQMRMSYALDSSGVFGDIVTLPGGTVLRWVDLGTVQIPLGYDPESDGLSGTPLSVRGVQVAVYAARVSGSGSLDIDTLMFAPADDRYCAVRWPEYGSPTSYVLDSGSNQVYAVGASGEVRATVTEMAGLPPMISPGVTNRIVFLRDVGDETEAGDAITASVAVTPYYWPRYLTVRPVAS